MTTRAIAADEQQFFVDNGYLIIRELLSREEVGDLQQWAQQVHDWPNDDTVMHYEEVNAHGSRVLCRTENYAASHAGLNSLLRGGKLLGLLRQLSGEDMVLFKEKINYKLAGSGGFSAHIDGTAYTHVKNIKHLGVLLAVDPCNMANGGLEVVSGSHRLDIPLGSDNCIEPEWTKQQQWLPVSLDAGEVMIFGSYLAHRSGPNQSQQDRKALYATYNCAKEGDMHDQYYLQRRAEWPPTHLRTTGDESKFQAGSLRYAYGSPMLSVELGHQFAV